MLPPDLTILLAQLAALAAALCLLTAGFIFGWLACYFRHRERIAAQRRL